MTIRTRLIAAAFLSSAIVAGAAAVSTAFLFDAAWQLDVIQSSQLPLLDSTKRILDSASNLALHLDDYGEAVAAGDRPGAEAARAKADQGFALLESTIHAAEQRLAQVKQTGSPEGLLQFQVLRSQVDALAQEWRRFEMNGLTQPEHSEAAELDDHAIHLVVGVVGLQDQASEAIANAVTNADSNIHSVCRISITVASLMTLVTLTTGMMFATNLARRLIWVKEQTKRVGSGQLETSIAVEGKDEIDEIAVSFNEMVRDLRGSRAELERVALFDLLTGLPNRSHFLAKLTERINRGVRTGDHGYALYFIDVDRFKTVNDTLGHAAGDEVLRGVASRLQQVVTDQVPSNGATVARLGGDEFTILIDSISPLEVLALGERLRAISFAASLDSEGQRIAITLSIGMAVGSDSVTEPKQILNRADVALYHTKRHGRNGCTLYSDSMVASHESLSRRANRVGLSEKAA